MGIAAVKRSSPASQRELCRCCRDGHYHSTQQGRGPAGQSAHQFPRIEADRLARLFRRSSLGRSLHSGFDFNSACFDPYAITSRKRHSTRAGQSPSLFIPWRSRATSAAPNATRRHAPAVGAGWPRSTTGSETRWPPALLVEKIAQARCEGDGNARIFSLKILDPALEWVRWPRAIERDSLLELRFLIKCVRTLCARRCDATDRRNCAKGK
jgi:hypothetical protein